MSLLLDRLNWFDMLVVPCSSTKGNPGEKAKDFYQGKGYFLHQKRLAEISGKEWMILSTKFGLVHPTFIIPESYDLIWSKKVQADNKSMRGKFIPTATEEHRKYISTQANKKLKGRKVLSFCSLHYEDYFPDWYSFNRLAQETLDPPLNSRGIQFLVETMNKLYLEIKDE